MTFDCGWVELKDIATITMGQSPKSEFYNSNSEGMPFIQGCTEFGDIFPVFKKHTSSWNKEAKAGDLLMSVRAPVGTMNLANCSCAIGRGIAAIRPNDNIDKNYLFYLLKIKERELNDQSSGTIFPSINKKSLESLSFYIPCLSEQKEIGSFLRSLDDKIANNKATNDTLESMAQRIFKSWFVDFDPVHYNARGEQMPGLSPEIQALFPKSFVESELGLVPEGWEISSITKSDNFKIIKPGLKNPGGEIEYFATADIQNGEILKPSKLSFSEKPSRANMQPVDGAVWFAKMSGYPKYLWTMAEHSKYWENKVLSTGFAGIAAKNKQLESLLFQFIKSDKFMSTKDSLSSGTTMVAINNNSMSNIKLLIPSSEILHVFDSITRPMMNKVYGNIISNKTLEYIRDKLLPKLISGDIEAN